VVVLKIDDTFQHLLRSDSEIDTLHNPHTIEVPAIISAVSIYLCKLPELLFQLL